MSENGTAYAAALTIRQVLRLLESKGLLSSAEIRQALDAATGELREAGARGVLSQDASALAAETIGMMSPPWSEIAKPAPASIAPEDLNASNDE